MGYKQISVPLRPSNSGKRVRKITVRLLASNIRGTVYFTDLILQTGTTNTGWVGHVSEIKYTQNG